VLLLNSARAPCRRNALAGNAVPFIERAFGIFAAAGGSDRAATGNFCFVDRR